MLYRTREDRLGSESGMLGRRDLAMSDNAAWMRGLRTRGSWGEVRVRALVGRGPYAASTRVRAVGRRGAKERRKRRVNPQRLHNAVQGLCTAGLARVEMS